MQNIEKNQAQNQFGTNQKIIFKKAERKRAKLKIAITGPSGSGKTYSALLLASGFLGAAGKIAVLDTENGSASLYSEEMQAHGFDYDTMDFLAPFSPEKYIQAIDAAVSGGYDFLIIDSLSHAWVGEGGILDKKAKLDSRPGSNSYTNWNQLTPMQEKLFEKIKQSPIHIIACMRSKQDYILADNGKGKMAPQKVGMAPMQRDGAEYEFTAVFDLGMDHQFAVSKDRTHLFDGRIEKITQQHGAELAAWHMSAKELSAALPSGSQQQENRDFIGELKNAGWSKKQGDDWLLMNFGPTKPGKGRTLAQLEAMISAAKQSMTNNHSPAEIFKKIEKLGWKFEEAIHWLQINFELRDGEIATAEQWRTLLAVAERNAPDAALDGELELQENE